MTASAFSSHTLAVPSTGHDPLSMTWVDDSAQPRCPGCSGGYPLWKWVAWGSLSILTHDGELICPQDKTYGALALSLPAIAEAVCADCSGSGEVIDRDGSVSGTVGAVVPCICAEPCPKCSGSGEVWGLWVLSAEQESYFEGVGPCSCQRGRA